MQFYFKRILEKLAFDFVPIYSVDNDSIIGYKIIKDFTPVGFDDKDYTYQMAYEEGIFEIFVLQLLEKAYKVAIEKGLNNTLLFYTLRMNYISHPEGFFEKINKIVKNYNLNKELLVFDIKCVENWHSFYTMIESVYHYKNILKENKNEKLTSLLVNNSKASFIEVRTITNFDDLKDTRDDIKKIFNLSYNTSLSKNDLKKLGVHYYYNY